MSDSPMQQRQRHLQQQRYQDDNPKVRRRSSTDDSCLDNRTSSRRDVSFYVLMPLTWVRPECRNKLAVPTETLRSYLFSLKEAGVVGVVLDFWWGIIQHDDLKKYTWDAYIDFVKLAREVGLKVCPILSFHSCGGNVGDDITISLPKKILDIGSELENPPFYTDRRTYINYEYISLGADDSKLFDGMSPLELYRNLMRDFSRAFSPYRDVIDDVEIGLGPCGELRYPSYPKGRWEFPYIGNFQCYDFYMDEMMRNRFKHLDYTRIRNGMAGINGYYQLPRDSELFNWDQKFYLAEPMKTFLTWHSDHLIDHGDKILKIAKEELGSMGVKLVAKVAGVHWHYNHEGHPAETISGYANSMPPYVTTEKIRLGEFDEYIKSSFYYKFAILCRKHDVEYNYTCFELAAYKQTSVASSNPEMLFQQVLRSVELAGVPFRGENALEVHDDGDYARILQGCKDASRVLTTFTYLRFTQLLVTEGQERNRFLDLAAEFKKGIVPAN